MVAGARNRYFSIVPVLLIVFAGFLPLRAQLLDCDFTGTAPGVNTQWTQTSVLAPNLNFSGWTMGPGGFGQAADKRGAPFVSMLA